MIYYTFSIKLGALALDLGDHGQQSWMPERVIWKCNILYKNLCLGSPLCRHPGDLSLSLRAALSLSPRAQKWQTLSTPCLPHSPALSPALAPLKDSCRINSYRELLLRRTSDFKF